MFRPSPLWLLLCFGAVFPISCSNDKEADSDSVDSDAGTGGSGLNVGDGDGDGDGDANEAEYCEEFRGLGACGSDAVTATREPVNILLVLDKSGSMDSKPDPDSASTLWEATTTALEGALLSTNRSVHFGLQTYPKNVGIECYPDCCTMPEDEEAGVTVPVDSGDEHRELIVTQLNRTTPGGGTPTADALAKAFSYFSTGGGKDLEGKRFVLLATDGGPNCNEGLECDADECTINIDDKCELPNDGNCCESSTEGCLDDTGTLGQIELLRGIDVDTFVVGLSGSEQYAAQLDGFAVAGGRARTGADEDYYKVGAEGSSDGLRKVLNKITRDLVQSCDIQLSEPPLDPNKLNVAVDCNVIPRGESGTQGDAGAGGEAGDSWELDTSTSPPTVSIQGAICEEIKTEGVERVDIVSGCPTVR